MALMQHRHVHLSWIWQRLQLLVAQVAAAGWRQQGLAGPLVMLAALMQHPALVSQVGYGQAEG